MPRSETPSYIFTSKDKIKTGLNDFICGAPLKQKIYFERNVFPRNIYSTTKNLVFKKLRNKIAKIIEYYIHEPWRHFQIDFWNKSKYHSSTRKLNATVYFQFSQKYHNCSAYIYFSITPEFLFTFANFSPSEENLLVKIQMY